MTPRSLTSHAPAIPRRRVDVIDAMRRLLRRRPGQPDGSWTLLHLHDVPRLYVRTTEGDVAIPLQGSCFYKDALAFRFALVAPTRMVVSSVLMRLASTEKTLDSTFTLDVGDEWRFSWVIEGGGDDDPEEG